MRTELEYKDDRTIFREQTKDGVLYLQYPLFEDTGLVHHGFSTRRGGVSEGQFESMNLSFSRGDSEEAVRENFRRFCKAVDVQEENLVFSRQTHTANVRKITERDLGNGYLKQNAYEDVDGMVTDVPGICLVTFYADCVPLFFLDPVHRAIGLSHSGWRGTVGKIGKNTLELMKEEYGTAPEDVLAAVGPSICRDCYEVSEDVIDQFRENFSKDTWQDLFYQKENGKYQLDLWRANEEVLLEAGILKEHMAVTNLCTCCNSRLLFSHRASQGKRGNLAAFLALRER